MLLLMALGTACRPEAGTSSNVASAPHLPGVVFDDAGDPVSVPDDFRVRLEWYGGIEGKAFQVTLLADGRGVYFGTGCVMDSGPTGLALSDQEFSHIVRQLGLIEFFDVPERYAKDVAGLPFHYDDTHIDFSVTSGGENAEFTDKLGYEQMPSWTTDLRELETEILRASGVYELTGGGTSYDTSWDLPCQYGG